MQEGVLGATGPQEKPPKGTQKTSKPGQPAGMGPGKTEGSSVRKFSEKS